MSNVFIALSGGVDSAVAAHLLLQQGHCVSAITMDNGCGNAAEEAAAVAEFLGIPHYVVDLKAEFTDLVTKPFVAGYCHGRTPNPCVFCNPQIKFGLLLQKAQELGAEYLATGHYVSKTQVDGHSFVARAADAAKDQSYFLYRLTEAQLNASIFPLGDLSKEQVREIAKSMQLPPAEKKDSQDVCFICGDYRDYLRAHGVKPGKGDFVDSDGKKLGQHDGLPFYTIGQRRGLGLALGYPAYVVQLNAAQNQVVVGREEELFATTAICEDVHLTVPQGESFRALAKVRYRSRIIPAAVELRGDKMLVTLDTAERSVTPGQSLVLYDETDTYVLGGGVITADRIW
ncbi:MAG: tRNA 2-thiouridine(34) synthase MnmA [Firmicutes bacterium]|nr:tRNA 2-thiouridine(34) synthase MnmA [Bacillota bacterium]